MRTDSIPARPVVAAFDVDGTLTTGDCVVPFLRLIAGTARVAAGLGRSARRVVPALARRDRDTIKAAAAHAAFAGRPIADVDAAGERFAASIERDRLRSDSLARIRWHQGQGHRVVLVSASFGAYLRPLAARLELDGVVATELVVGPDGRCTGELVEGNCRGPEKRRRLHRWLDDHARGRSGVVVWAYGDSPGDRDLLADADRAVWMSGPLPAAPEAAT